MDATPPETATRIGIFGGTFDPFHLGHLYLAKLAKDALELDEVRFVPCQISPHKTDSDVSSCGDRCEILNRSLAGIPWAVVDECEVQEPGPSYSFRTASSMAERFPEARLFWIMGGDQWDALPTWKNPTELAQRVEFIVLARGKSTPDPREGYRLHTVRGSHPASASAIREALAAGASDHPWLAPSAMEWIRTRGLYQPA